MAEIQNISIELVKVHPNKVRKTYNDIEELAESIKAKGILQNLTVVPDPQEPGKYLTVIGNRRLTAARMAGLETVPCIVSDMDEKEQTSVMLLEKIQRSDLTVYEQAQGAAGAQGAGPDMSGAAGGASQGSSEAGYGDDVVDADYKEV